MDRKDAKAGANKGRSVVTKSNTHGARVPVRIVNRFVVPMSHWAIGVWQVSFFVTGRTHDRCYVILVVISFLGMDC
jgi:hypothetical protein